MADVQFLRLSERWALAADRNQWVVQRRKSFDKRRGKWNWVGVAFVASNRDTLLRVLREKGAKIDPDKLEAVHALPYEFKTWLELQRGSKRCFKGCDSAISAHGVG